MSFYLVYGAHCLFYPSANLKENKELGAHEEHVPFQSQMNAQNDLGCTEPVITAHKDYVSVISACQKSRTMQQLHLKIYTHVHMLQKYRCLG
jgi:hypothetical protein